MNDDQTSGPNPGAGDRSSRLRTRQRAELARLCHTGDLPHAVDLAFEHLAEHGPDPSLLCELCAAGRRAGVSPVARARLHELVRRQLGAPDDGADPCQQLLARSRSTPS